LDFELIEYPKARSILDTKFLSLGIGKG